MKPLRQILYFFILLSLPVRSYSQTVTRDSFNIIKVKPSKFKKDYCKEKLSRTKKNLVTLSFFNFFQDSISVLIDNRIVFKKYVSKDTSIISTDYSNFSYVINLPSNKTNVSIISLKQKIKIVTKLKRKYPVYLISTYNGEWYIRPSKCFPLIK